MKLNLKGFFKAASLCSLAFALTGCITWGLVSNTASRPHAEQWRSDTIKGLSLAEDRLRVYRWQKIVTVRKAMFLLVNRWTIC